MDSVSGIFSPSLGKMHGLSIYHSFLWFVRKDGFCQFGKRLALVILLAAAQATMGWIMVKRINDDTRTWVSAYKLVYQFVACDYFAWYSLQYLLHAQYGSQPMTSGE